MGKSDCVAPSYQELNVLEKQAGHAGLGQQRVHCHGLGKVSKSTLLSCYLFCSIHTRQSSLVAKLLRQQNCIMFSEVTMLRRKQESWRINSRKRQNLDKGKTTTLFSTLFISRLDALAQCCLRPICLSRWQRAGSSIEQLDSDTGIIPLSIYNYAKLSCQGLPQFFHCFGLPHSWLKAWQHIFRTAQCVRLLIFTHLFLFHLPLHLRTFKSIRISISYIPVICGTAKGQKYCAVNLFMQSFLAHQISICIVFVLTFHQNKCDWCVTSARGITR